MTDITAKLSGTTTLVTGGAGFIGSHLCDRLMDYGAKVVCFDNLSSGNKYYLESKKGNAHFVFIQGDVNNLADLGKVFLGHKIDYLMHYAAVVGVLRTMEQPFGVLSDLEGIKHICSLSTAHGVKKIVYASSSEIYGDQKEMPLHEDMSYYDTKHPYALVKATAESYFKSFSQVSGIPVVSLRFFNVYGPRQESSDYGFVSGIFIAQVLRGLQPIIFRDGTQTRDFTYINDNVEAAIRALVNDNANGGIINIGTGKETSILELAKKIIAISGKKLEPSLMNTRTSYEVQRRVAHVGKMKDLLGFECTTSLDAGLGKTFEWYKSNPQLLLKDKDTSYKSYQEKIWVPKKKENRG